MHLAHSVEALACQTNWADAQIARKLADANLGELLGESGLGVSLELSPQLGFGSTSSSLVDRLDQLAREAGLPEAAEFSHPIFLPYESGVPIIMNGAGFSATGNVITTATLGWTLAREAQYISSCDHADDPLDRYLSDVVSFTIDGQLSWISASMISAGDAGAYLPAGTRASVAGGVVSYGLSDPRSTVYGQSSLLIGLLTAGETAELKSDTRQLARELAGDTLDQLLSHWDEASGAFVDLWQPGEGAEAASWYDQGIAAEALDSTRKVTTDKRTSAGEILQSMAQRALDDGSQFDAVDESGRLLVLLIAGQALKDDDLIAAAVDGWNGFLNSYYDEGTGSFTLSYRTLRGWGHTPGELSIVFDLIARLTTLPQESTSALTAASSLLQANVITDRVQLTDPFDFWNEHVQPTCNGIARVFGISRGSLPAWLEFLP